MSPDIEVGTAHVPIRATIEATEKAEVVPPVQHALGAIEFQVNTMSDHLDRLEAKLSPVIGPPNTPMETIPDADGYGVPIADEALRLADRLARMNVQVDYLAQRIAL